MTPEEVLKEIEAIKKALAAYLHKPVREDIWELLIEDRYVQEVIDFPYEDSFERLKERYLFLDSRFPPTGRNQTARENTEREIPPDKRLITFAKITAIEAARHPDVISFRENVLGGQLLNPEDIKEWIEEQAKNDGKATTWIKIKTLLPADADTAVDRNSRVDSSRLLELVAEEKKDPLSVSLSRDNLDYLSLGDALIRCVPVNKDGILGRLKKVAGTLVKEYPWWSEQQAVAFVLCGTIPLYPKARCQIVISNKTPARIRLDLDPRLNKQEVAELYSSLRQKVFQGRDRDMEDKHLELAVFLAEYPTGRTWPELMELWNQEKREDWAYSDFRWFSRDARSAWERVTGKRWVHRP